MKKEYVSPETEVFTPESEELMQGDGGGFITTSDDDTNYGKENRIDFEEDGDQPSSHKNLWDD